MSEQKPKMKVKFRPQAVAEEQKPKKIQAKLRPQVVLTPDQKASVAKSIRAQYKAAGTTFVPPVVAKARALRLVLQKGPEVTRNKLTKGLKASRNRLTALGQRVAKTRSKLEAELESLAFYESRYRSNPTPALARIIEKQKARIAAIQGK